MQYSEIMVRYGELSTKGKNRKDFIRQLGQPQLYITAISDAPDNQPASSAMHSVLECFVYRHDNLQV